MINLNGNTTEEKLGNLTLSEIVTINFKAAAVFENYNLDFCCRGNKLFSTACEEKGIDTKAVIADLDKFFMGIHPFGTSTAESNGRYNEWDLDFLSDYIVNNHHSYVRSMIPIISAHVQKVATVHGKNHPETIDMARIFTIVYKDLKQHMMKEEEILFPYIKHLVKTASTSSKREKPYFGTVQNPIAMMQTEHEAAGDSLFEIRNLSNNYTPPEDACNTYNVCYQELKDFEEDLHKHIHLENNILFPKAISLEKELLAA